MNKSERETRPQAYGESPHGEPLKREESPVLEPDHMPEDRTAPRVANEQLIHRQAEAHGTAHDPQHVDGDAPLDPLREPVHDVDPKADAETRPNQLKQAALNKNLDPSG